MITTTIGLAQINAPVKMIRGNLEKMEAVVEKAKEANVDVVCFPELNIVGYCLGDYVKELAQPIPGQITETVEAMAKKTQITIIADRSSTRI